MFVTGRPLAAKLDARCSLIVFIMFFLGKGVKFVYAYISNCQKVTIVFILGGEERVIELLENAARKEISVKLLKDEDEEVQHHHSISDFIFRPIVFGKDLYTILKFGVVQYVSGYNYLSLYLFV